VAGLSLDCLTLLDQPASEFVHIASRVGYGGVSLYMGLVLGLQALFATIIGGFGTIEGAIVGGFLLAGIETLWSAYFPIVYRDVAVFLIVMFMFIIKPDGLLSVGLRRDSEG